VTGRDGRLRAVVAGGLAAAAARAAYRLLTRMPPGGAAAWARTNHRGEQLTLLEGPALAAGAVLAAAAAPGLPPRARAAMMAAAAGAAACGGYDDLAGSGDRRGFRGHLGALAHGEVTTGTVKLGGIGAAGLAASGLLGGPPADVLVNAGLIAGGANLVNLFDLRPGRAIKVAVAGGLLAAVPGSAARRRVVQAAPAGAGRAGAGRAGAAGGSGAPLPAGALLAVPLGAALALAGEDLGERAMLGDAGANALGALLGTVAAASLSRPARLALLAGITGLTAASEVVSFTRVIERTRPLRWLDMLGRRLPATAAAGQGTDPGQPGTVAAPGAQAAGPGTQAPATPR
jgi:UDP-GlcNAc:undecaprenyl-phosphate GlcNAc-1-phosphate transferase